MLTEKLLKRFQEVGEQDVPNPIVIAHYFHPYSSWHWYATAYYPKDKLFFGWVKGTDPELGYFSVEELESVRLMGLPMERDLAWKEKHLYEVEDYV